MLQVKYESMIYTHMSVIPLNVSKYIFLYIDGYTRQMGMLVL